MKRLAASWPFMVMKNLRWCLLLLVVSLGAASQGAKPIPIGGHAGNGGAQSSAANTVSKAAV